MKFASSLNSDGLYRLSRQEENHQEQRKPYYEKDDMTYIRRISIEEELQGRGRDGLYKKYEQ
jgi:hypothetical protein